jgi:hypothetical protein
LVSIWWAKPAYSTNDLGGVEMINLALGKCVACRAGELTATGIESEMIYLQIPEGRIMEEEHYHVAVERT